MFFWFLKFLRSKIKLWILFKTWRKKCICAFLGFRKKNYLLPLFRMRGEGVRGKKVLPPPPSSTSFSPITSTNVGITSKTLWLLVLNLLPHWCKIASLYLVPVRNYWTWTKITPQKKQFFWSKQYKIEVMITSLIEMLQLPNFAHINTSNM